MEARRRGYRQQEAAPPKRGHPLANLTRSMSQPASEPASAPTLRHIPRRYLALGLIIVAICLLGALVLVRDNSGPSTTSTVETFSPAPSSLVSTMTSVPGVGLRRRGGELAGQPGAGPAAGRERQRAAVAGHGRRRGAPAGGVLLRGRVRALRRRPALAADPRAVPLRHLQPARAHAVERDAPRSPTCRRSPSGTSRTRASTSSSSPSSATAP